MSGEPMEIWVDDCKPAPAGCAVARNYDDALRMLRRFDYATLYLDHDLGDDGRTGYDLLMELVRENIVPPRVVCISWNPVGRARILAALAAERDSDRNPQGLDPKDDSAGRRHRPKHPFFYP